MFYQSITTYNLAKQNVSKEILDNVNFAIQKNEQFFESKGQLISDLKKLSGILNYTILNCWILLKQKSDSNVFKTFDQWKNKGFKIKKGSKAFYILGYKDASFIMIDDEKTHKIVEWKNATDQQKRMVMEGDYEVIKKKIVAPIPVFGDKQIEFKKELENSKKSVNLRSFLLKTLKDMSISVLIIENSKDEVIFDESKNTLVVKYQNPNNIDFMILKMLSKLILKQDDGNLLEQLLNFESEIITFLIFENLNRNDYVYSFDDYQILAKNLSNEQKEDLLNKTMYIAKNILENIQ
ncbi:ArdC family protein [[Mycoplasma] gypis]|uniref:ArdC family protein n=1 Tax=[Mycoplasma] gypis TaxID=92404 RepID=A0ABZ2RQL8_9BACT|nr:ArdC family protein [[Mycoplasma] gypis]MBN0919275.1 DUF1738 domain-containing protein [[Mycoplasma] gypis]